MIVGLYAVRDSCAQAVAGVIMQFPHDAVAVRSFRELAADQQSTIARNLKDYDLVCIGAFDTEKLLLEPCDPRVVVTGVSLIPEGGPAVRRMDI